MNVKKMTEELQEKYGFNMGEFMEVYVRRLSREDIAKRLDLPLYTIKKIGDGLRIKWPKGKRTAWYAEYLLSLNAMTTNEEEPQMESTKTIEYLTHKLSVASKALQRSRDESNYLRGESRKFHRKSFVENDTMELIESVVKGVEIPQQTFTVAEHIQTSEEGLIAVIGDWHIGDTAGADVPDNKFNYAIAELRVEKFIESVLNSPKQSSKLNVINLNDGFKGIIHDGLYTSEGSFIESLQRYLKLYVNMLSVFSLIYEEVNVYSTGDNHSRIHEKPTANDKHLDYSRLMDTIAHEIISAKGFTNVNIKTTDTGYHMLNVNSANILAFHGDTIRSYQASSTPSRSKLQDICMQTFNVPYRHAINGHQHEFKVQSNQYNGVNLTNGSLVGNTSYGYTNGMSGILPSQSILYVSEDGSMDTIKLVTF